MRILHVHNTGGQGVEITRALRKLGIKAECLVNYIQFKTKKLPDYNLNLKKKGKLFRIYKKIKVLPSLLNRYDVFHFHGNTFLPIWIDIIFLKANKKCVVMHYHGVELRRTFDKEESKEIYGGVFPFFRRLLMNINILIARRFASSLLVSTPDLLKYEPNAIWIPQPKDMKYFEKFLSKNYQTKSETPIIFHAPSDPQKKGTIYIERAIKELIQQGIKIKFEVITGRPYEEVIKKKALCDIYIDQVLLGWYGNAAVEAMALGKPVCVYIDPELEKYLPKPLPFVNVNLNNLSAKLIKLITNSDLREYYAKRGKTFVNKYHNSLKIAKKLLTLYEENVEKK